MEITRDIQYYQARSNNLLAATFNESSIKNNLLQNAMRYSVLNGGKRIRAILTYLSGETVNADLAVLDKVAMAIELIHAFSLIHDDLPALDNDDLRRGKLSCHKAFGEYTAILAGDALQSMAFEYLARLRKQSKLNAQSCLSMIEILSDAIGYHGMCQGEHLDLSIKKQLQKDQIKHLETIYKLKTSKLLYAAVILGLLAGNCHEKPILLHMSRFGLLIGIAFQIHDDILEVESDTQTLGKSAQSDYVNQSPTYVSLVNLDYAKQQRDYFYHQALEHLYKTGLHVDKIANLSQYIIQRNY